MKGTHNAFRNLTNRMEEAAGDCTNLHMSYPALVYGFWSVLRANVEGTAPLDTPAKIQLGENRQFKEPDIALFADGKVALGIQRYHFALEGLSNRSNLRDEPSKYEAVGITLVDVEPDKLGQVYKKFPDEELGLTYEKMLHTMYAQYDLRYVYQAPDLAKRGTRRLIWSTDSPAFTSMPALDYRPRVGPAEIEDDEGIANVEPAAREIEERGLGE